MFLGSSECSLLANSPKKVLSPLGWDVPRITSNLVVEGGSEVVTRQVEPVPLSSLVLCLELEYEFPDLECLLLSLAREGAF